jgi:hypothetical protein
MQEVQSWSIKRDIIVSDQPSLSSLHLLCLLGSVPSSMDCFLLDTARVTDASIETAVTRMIG